MGAIMLLVVLLAVLSTAAAFRVQYDRVRRPHFTCLRAAGDDDEDAPTLESEDWRAFRARLVMGDSAPSSSSSSWAYDSGHNIEAGSISK